MRQIKVVNKNNKEVVLTNKAPFILQSFEFKTGVNIYNSKSMNQDGASYNSNTLDVSEVTMQITVTSKSIDDLKENKRLIYEIFNPKIGEVTLINESKKVDCIVTEIPFFAPQSQRDEICLISLIAHNPYWQDIQETRTDVAIETGGFEFPLNVPVTGLELSIRTISFITNIYNQGDADTPIRVRLKAIGTVENPTIINLKTGEFIKVKRTLAKDDILEINTEFGNKKVEIIRENGIRENAFNYIDYKSKFFSISSGDTKLRYGADLGDSNLDVYIYYTPRYLGV